MKHYDYVIINNDKFNSFRLYQLLMEAGELKLIKMENFPDGIQVGDIIFKHLASQYEPLEIYIKIDTLNLQVYDKNGWLCPIKTRVMLSIMGLIKGLCQYFEEHDPNRKAKRSEFGPDDPNEKFNINLGKDITLLNALRIDVGWNYSKNYGSNKGVLGVNNLGVHYDY